MKLLGTSKNNANTISKICASALCIFALSLLLSIGLLHALGGATVTSGGQSRWTGTTAGNVVTEGGNISYVNLSVVSLTDKWAAFYGNISGTINLTYGGTYSVYSWSWTTASGGKVCISENSSGLNESAYTTATAANINTAYSQGSATDNATQTFTLTNCTLNFAQATVTSTLYLKHLGSSTFYTCPVYDGVSAAKQHFLFCTNISSSGTTFNNTPANYEIMVPTAPGTGTETYYFYAELN